ncbi:hypothetical protein EG329_007027 [Mollisiaceae sp. DMI_Dod_QoI]|nr:hypothetical protein EG329_007027 [Helotiales sp. DMI_Dod_QoI]
MPRIREIFSDIEPFVSAINTMVQANAVAALVWGSLTLVFQVTSQLMVDKKNYLLTTFHIFSLSCGFSDLFDNTSQMLFELSRALPRFKQYTEIFHTPRLHQALRDVYEGFVDFCFRTSEVLQTNTCCESLAVLYEVQHQCYRVLTSSADVLMQGKWASFDNEFQRTRERLNFASSEFDKESRLADVQEQSKRHKEILSQLRTMSTGSNASSHGTFCTNVTLPRNERFVGRDGILAQIHSDLTPSLDTDFSLRTRCSTVVHAVGWMGKIETVLEYTYRYQHSYSHIFWLRAQTRSGLLDSFLEVIEKLGLDVNRLVNG